MFLCEDSARTFSHEARRRGHQFHRLVSTLKFSGVHVKTIALDTPRSSSDVV
jgi:hypothetical protein